MKVKVFSHNDLDGVGCVIVANAVFGKENVDFSLCNYNEINDKVLDFVVNLKYKEYDKVFITDISVNEEVAECVDIADAADSGLVRFQLIDHHITAAWLNKYDWALVQESYTLDSLDNEDEQEVYKTSGTSMLYDWLIEEGYYDGSEYVQEFAELVRRYDTWEWTTRYNDQHAKRLNDLLYIIGQGKFIERFTENIDPVFTTGEVTILDVEEERIKKYIDSKAKQLFTLPLEGYVAGVVFSEQYVSQLGNELAKRYDQLDLIVLIDVGAARISYRTIKDSVDVSAIAKTFGGGGHVKSSGSTFQNRDQTYFFTQKIFGQKTDEMKANEIYLKALKSIAEETGTPYGDIAKTAIQLVSQL